MSKLLKILFIFLLIALAVSFFERDNYKTIKQSDIVPSLFGEPLQKEISDKTTVKFTRNDYQYEITPLFNYELNGLVVRKTDYTFLSIYKRSSVFPVDLCVIWGGNLREEVYRNKTLKFEQDMRFCFSKWSGNVNFGVGQFSNNHLVTDNNQMENKLKSLRIGDQIKIKGKLVNVKATLVGEAGKYDPRTFIWNTSTTRTDVGDGACETIFVEEMEILKRADTFMDYLYFFSFYGLVALIFSRIIYFFWEVTKK
ncbi:MAG: hypothetical protein Q7R75_03025 [bacterium]|nr:hypothetical protein [bacterium]